MGTEAGRIALSKSLLEAHDGGALHAINALREIRREHPVKWFLTGGRYGLDLLEVAVKSSRADGYDDASREMLDAYEKTGEADLMAHALFWYVAIAAFLLMAGSATKAWWLMIAAVLWIFPFGMFYVAYVVT